MDVLEVLAFIALFILGVFFIFFAGFVSFAIFLWGMTKVVGKKLSSNPPDMAQMREKSLFYVMFYGTLALISTIFLRRKTNI